MSALATIIKLHGGPSPEEFKRVLRGLLVSDVNHSDYDFGPAHGNAVKDHEKAIEIMEKFLKKL